MYWLNIFDGKFFLNKIHAFRSWCLDNRLWITMSKNTETKGEIDKLLVKNCRMDSYIENIWFCCRNVIYAMLFRPITMSIGLCIFCRATICVGMVWNVRRRPERGWVGLHPLKQTAWADTNLIYLSVVRMRLCLGFSLFIVFLTRFHLSMVHPHHHHHRQQQ